MAPKKAKRTQAVGDSGSSNVFEQSQIQEYKEIKNMRADVPSDVAGKVDDKNITPGEEKEE